MLSIGVVSFVFFFPPVYMREPKNPDRLFEKNYSKKPRPLDFAVTTPLKGKAYFINLNGQSNNRSPLKPKRPGRYVPAFCCLKSIF